MDPTLVVDAGGNRKSDRGRLERQCVNAHIGSTFPQTTVQTCIVHLIRNLLDYASWKDRNAGAAAIKPIYTAAIEAAAKAALDDFAAGPWGGKYATISGLWPRAWEHVIPFFAFPPDVRRIIYTTNTIESVHMRLRKIIKTRGISPPTKPRPN